MLMSKEDMPVMTSGADSTSTAVELVRTPIGLGLTIDSQYKVLALAKDGQAERSRGIAVGDQLVSMNGVPLSGGGAFDAFDEQLGAIPMGTKVTLVISKPAGSAKDRISQISVPTASADSPPPPSLPPADNRGQHSTVIHDDFDGKDIVVTISDSTEGTAPQDLPAVLVACGLEHLTSAFEAEKYTLKSLLAAMKEGDRAAMRDLHELGLNLGESRKLINQLKKASK